MKINNLIITFLILFTINAFSLNNNNFLKKFYQPKNKKFYKFKTPIKSKRIKKVKNNAELFLDDINNSRKSIKTMYIKAKVDIIKKFIRVKGEMEINIVFPNKIIIKTSVLGFTISTLLINGNKLYFKDHVKKTLKIRKATNRNISRHIPIKLSLRQFKQMLRGAPPTINFSKISINNKNTNLTLKNYKETQYLKFNKDKNIKEMTLFQKNKKRINIKFSKMKSKDGYSYASKINFKDYKKEVKSKLQITNIEFNKQINLNLFKALK